MAVELMAIFLRHNDVRSRKNVAPIGWQENFNELVSISKRKDRPKPMFFWGGAKPKCEKTSRWPGATPWVTILPQVLAHRPTMSSFKKFNP